MSFDVSLEEKRILLRTARESIRTAFSGESGRNPEPTENLRTECGAFVTLRADGQLRGCIGNVTAEQPLFDAVGDLARSSAFRDPRFSPITEEELSEVEIEISVLTPLEPIEAEEVEVGTHGLLMRSGLRSGLLLPQVPVEQDWDREQFLTHTCYKAGLPGSCWQDPDTEIFAFTAIVFSESEEGV
jgi:AmmeMemoRadiSam system protein A